MNDHPLPRHLNFLDPGNKLLKSFNEKDFNKYDVLIGLDIYDKIRVEFLTFERVLKIKKLCFVDHHMVEDNFKDNFLRWIDPTKASVGSMVYELIEYFKVPFTLEMAKGIYLSLIADTGNFGSGTTVGSHEIKRI